MMEIPVTDEKALLSFADYERSELQRSLSRLYVVLRHKGLPMVDALEECYRVHVGGHHNNQSAGPEAPAAGRKKKGGRP